MNGWRQGFELAPAANWPIATVRTFLWDPVNGLDTNVGYSDGAGPYNPATLAKKTIAGVRAVFPVAFNGRKFRLIMAAGTYATGLEQIINGATGIGANSLIRGTATNLTASTTAFSDDAADRIYQGWATATGMNAAGYVPTGSPTTTVVQCLKAAGGAPGFGAEPALPGGVRIRFDSTTTTAALRNIARSIVQVTGTDTLTLDSALPAVPVGADTFYIEMGGLSFPTQSLFIGASGVTSTLQLCGLFSAGSLTLGTGDWRTVGAKVNAFQVQGFTHSQQQTGFVETTTGATVAIGGCVRSETTAVYNRGEFMSASTGACFTVGQFSVSAVAGASMTNVVAQQIANSGMPNTTITGRTFGAGSTSAVLLAGGGNVTTLSCVGAGAKPAIAFNSFVQQGYAVSFGIAGSISGSTGNTDVGFDCTGAQGCTFTFGSTPTITGSLGDVRVAGGAILTWAQVLAGYVDANGNRFVAAGVEASRPTAAPAVLVFRSASQDLLTAGAAFDIPIPDIGGGKLFHIVNIRLDISAQVGTGTGSVTMPIIRNGVTYITPTLAVAQFNALTAPYQLGLTTSGPTVDPSVAHVLQSQVTTPFGGFTTMTGKVAVQGYYE